MTAESDREAGCDYKRTKMAGFPFAEHPLETKLFQQMGAAIITRLINGIVSEMRRIMETVEQVSRRIGPFSAKKADPGISLSASSSIIS